eukprot:TRINITY_DN10215_c0_g1_i20.p1 TRINITY_DN10215_c0_g1~~TRINITY_DN10215_c0_g1_i20.p1  ORF type:complete len:155 (-),score=25.29 TRINITY_DN10215_c0_g1_i20:148-612(-)
MTGGLIDVYTFSDDPEDSPSISPLPQIDLSMNNVGVASTGEHTGHQRSNSVSLALQNSYLANNPFRDYFEEHKQSAANHSYTGPVAIDTPPSYSADRVTYQRTPNCALRKRRKIRQVPSEILPLAAIRDTKLSSSSPLQEVGGEQKNVCGCGEE